MKLSLIQYNPEWENKEQNKQKLLGMLTDECMESLIIFPEMTLTGFTMNASEFAEPANGYSYDFFSGIAKDFNSFVLAGIIEKEGDKIFNSLFYIQPEGELVSVYRKIHPFSYSSENKFYTAGKDPVSVEIAEFKTGLSICYDLRFPELYRFYARERASLIIDVANWPDVRIEHWRSLLKARAIENQSYVAGVNRTGTDPKSRYNGFSSVFDPMGKELAALEENEGVISVNISIDYVNEIRTKLPFLNDMVLV